MKEIVLGTVAVVLAATGVRAADFTAAIDHNWHQWRGPAANGVAPHADPPVRWDETTHIKWKVPIPGRGTSTPIVWQDQVFVLSAVETDRGVATLAEPKAVPPGGYKTLRPMKLHQFLILSFDRETGRLRWSQIANETLPHEGHHGNHGYASASPTTDGRRLYVSYGSRGVYAYDLNGKRLWKRDLGEMITRFGWGEATSPVLHGDALAVNWDHEGKSRLYVLDARTGQTRWQVDRDEVTTWNTPVIIYNKGTTQLIVRDTSRARI